MISIYDTAEIEELRVRCAVQPHRMKLFRNALFKKAMGWGDALETLPENARAVFENEVAFELLTLAERHDSQIDGASKLIFKTDDGHLIESVVLRPKTGRTSICISSQVGCVCRCTFCATGKMGIRRDLTFAEIVDQVTQANRLIKPEGRTIRNVVFMGMGEPFLNPENLYQALDFLRAAPFHNLAGSRLMVSTVGIPKAMIQFAKRYPDVQQALSLHSAQQDVRETIMPLAKKYTLDLLREALLVSAETGKVMVEYLMLAGVNDGEDDLAALKDYLHGLPVHINLIPFNAFEGNAFVGTSQAERVAFADKLKAAGFDVTLRYSFGADIAAACGQLVQDS